MPRLTEIQKVWQVVSEDYAAFDVNVTTQDPGAPRSTGPPRATRSTGTRAAITNGGVIYTDCAAAASRTSGSSNTSGSNHGYYETAWSSRTAPPRTASTSVKQRPTRSATTSV